MDVAEMAGACIDRPPLQNVGTSTASLFWFAVRVREKFRAKAEQQFTAHGYEFFSPAVMETRQWSDRRKVMSVPLFSGYVFCRFSPDRPLPILCTPGVIDIVRFGARLAEVDAAELAAIKQALESTRAVDALPELVYGQRVRVMRGPMEGVEGALAVIRSNVRLILSVTMMNRSVAVEIDRADVAAIETITQ
jgi:transcription antitermination factor NusG